MYLLVDFVSSSWIFFVSLLFGQHMTTWIVTSHN